MANLADYAKEKNFGSSGESFPEGETIIDLKEAEVEPTTVEFGGETKQRWNITYKGKTYYTGVKVMKGIKKCQADGHTKVVVIRDGEKLDTTYIVRPLKE